MKTNTIKVKLIAHTPSPLDVAYLAMTTCYNPGTPSDKWSNISSIKDDKKIELIQKVINSGHTSTIEHIYFTFTIDRIDRNCATQLLRHRIASYSQQSLRYCNILKEVSIQQLEDIIKNGDIEQGLNIASQYFSDVNIDNYDIYIQSLLNYIKAIENGVKKEDARNLLCSNVLSNIVMTINARSFINFCSHRMCSRAQKPIRTLATQMVQAIKQTGEFKFLEQYLAPQCELLGYCPEGKSCGRKQTLQNILQGENKSDS